MSKIIKINDFNSPELDCYVRMTGAQLRNRLNPDNGIFIAESPTVIEVAIQGGCEPISFLTDERLLRDKVISLSEQFPDVPFYVADRDTLKELTGFELTRGMLAAMRRPKLLGVEELLKEARTVAILEEIADSTNVGAIFRSAAALGIDAVLVSPTCCDPLSRRAVRVSMGTVFSVPWTRIGETHSDWQERGIPMLKNMGFKLVALALRKDTVDIDSPELMSEEKLALVLGTEGTGLDDKTIDKCDYTVKIPMSNGVDALNVACAASVACWQIGRR